MKCDKESQQTNTVRKKQEARVRPLGGIKKGNMYEKKAGLKKDRLELLSLFDLLSFFLESVAEE